MKLSPAQARVLKALAEPGEYAHYMPYRGSFNPNDYWFFHNTMGRIRSKTMDKLESIGFIQVKKDSIGYPDTATITPAGRAYLENLEAQDAD